ncbi:MAG: hypothetical protein K0S35_1167 [Geminicoccaceae bacterium]|nr:hypothetical protein [Geminicoccaceae bacterium]
MPAVPSEVDEMNLIRPNGLIERLTPMPQPQIGLNGYGRSQPGPATATTMRLAARQERRVQPRRKTEPLRGRLVDLTA